MEEYAKSKPLKNYKYEIREEHSHHKGQYDNVSHYSEDIITFDIETTSFFYGDDLKPFLYRKGKSPEYWAEQNAGALPYLWQLGINDSYYYGRDLADFYAALEDFPNDLHAIFWIQSLNFEWHFLDRLHWDFVFAKSRHRPIKATCLEFPNIEFRCTYAMIDRSLAEWGEVLGIPKLEMNYNVLRTPRTRLSKKILTYGQRDLEIMYAGIKAELREYGSVWNIPLTSTGVVRQPIKKALMDNDDYKRFIKKLIPANWYQYVTSRRIFWGGYSHGSRCWLNVTWTDKLGEGFHGDFVSAYIAQMCYRKFPCTQWSFAPKALPDPEKDLNVKAYKLHLKFKNIRCETQNTFIPFDKCVCENAVLDNGKVISADLLEIWCSDLDYYIIRQMYTWGDKRKEEAEGVEVVEAWFAYMDYLPKVLVSILLDLFNTKTASKYVDSLEYFHSKKRLDAIYGMAATSVCQASVNWDINSEEWDLQKVTVRQLEERLHKLRYWRDNRYFVSYDWGIYIAAWSRFTLLNDIIIPNDRICMYGDTDSAFLAKRVDFTEYNERVARDIKAVLAERGFDPELASPVNALGEISQLGAFMEEPKFTEFRVLGSKRYCQRLKETGALSMTVSGINPEAVECLHNDIKNFKDGMVFDKDAEDVSKLLHTYFDRQPDIVFPDGYISTQRRGVNLRPNGYRLRSARKPEEIIKDLAKGARVSEYDKHLRGVIHEGGTD